jgi:Putative auto-transporter adhesin, head GIN domain
MRIVRPHVLPAAFRGFVVVAAAAAFLSVFPSLREARADDLVPSGRIQSETRTPGHFVRVSVGGPFDVEVRQGSREAVTITGDDNLLPLVETRIENEDGGAELKVQLRHDLHLDKKTHMKVLVEVVKVNAIAFGGIGDVYAKDIKADKLTVILGGVGHINLPGVDAGQLGLTIGGAGSIKVDGRASKAQLVIAGSGNCECDGLASSDVEITIAGSGNAKVRADKALKVTIAGSGNVTYRGDVEPTTTVIGSGKISKV